MTDTSFPFMNFANNTASVSADILPLLVHLDSDARQIAKVLVHVITEGFASFANNANRLAISIPLLRRYWRDGTPNPIFSSRISATSSFLRLRSLYFHSLNLLAKVDFPHLVRNLSFPDFPNTSRKIGSIFESSHAQAVSERILPSTTISTNTRTRASKW